jgi:hypothetical protein
MDINPEVTNVSGGDSNNSSDDPTIKNIMMTPVPAPGGLKETYQLNYKT